MKGVDTMRIRCVAYGLGEKGTVGEKGTQLFLGACNWIHYCNATTTTGLSRTYMFSCSESRSGEATTI